MRLAGAIAPLATAMVLSGCMVVPEANYDEASLRCNTYTHSMTLRTVEMKRGEVYCNDEACLAMILAVSAGSVIVSGSIVLTNNTLHWLEYQGTCSDGYLKTATQKLLDSLDNPKPIAAKAL